MPLPSNFTKVEIRQVEFILAHARAGLKHEHPEWLISDLDEDVWVIRSRQSKLIDGKWVDVVRVRWSVQLADGTKLNDPQHRDLLSFVKISIVKARTLSTLRRVSTKTFVQWIRDVIAIVKWVCKYSDEFNPDNYFLRYLDGPSIDRMIEDLGSGCHIQMMEWVKSCLDCLLVKTEYNLGRGGFNFDPFNLPKNVCRRISRWIEMNSLYGRSRGLRRVKRKELSRLLGLPNLESNSRLTLFFRQFEPELQAWRGGYMGRATNLWQEQPPNATNIASPRRSRSHLNRFVRSLQIWCSLQPHFPQAFPLLGDWKSGMPATKLASNVAGHTPWLPMPVALVYLREAMAYVCKYGNALVDMCISTLKKFAEQHLLPSSHDAQRYKVGKRNRRDEIVMLMLSVPLRELNINGWCSVYGGPGNFRSFAQLRERPSLCESLAMLVAAVSILIATLKPIRLMELLTLERDCLHVGPDGGAWLEHTQLKRVVQDRREAISRPIPNIVAQAISLLIRLGDACSEEIWGLGRRRRGGLFYLPAFTRDGGEHGIQLTRNTFYRYVDNFADYIAPSNESDGVRWYIRIHQLRKSFLIAYFWCYRFGGLDAARWIAGHTDAEHVFAYIEANFPGDELPGIEADYARQQLLAYEGGGEEAELGKVDELYRSVCNHFCVSSAMAIDTEELREWLKIAFSQKLYRIEVVNLQQGTAASVSIVVRLDEGGKRAKKRGKGSFDGDKGRSLR